MHGTRRSYVYFLDCSGSNHYDRDYFLHGSCGEEIVGSEKGEKIFDVIIQGGKFLFRAFVLYKKVTPPDQGACILQMGFYLRRLRF